MDIDPCGAKIEIYAPELRSSNSNGLARAEISSKLLRRSLLAHRVISTAMQGRVA